MVVSIVKVNKHKAVGDKQQTAHNKPPQAHSSFARNVPIQIFAMLVILLGTALVATAVATILEINYQVLALRISAVIYHLYNQILFLVVFDYDTYWLFINTYDPNCLSYDYWSGNDCLLCADNYYLCSSCYYDSYYGYFDGCSQSWNPNCKIPTDYYDCSVCYYQSSLLNYGGWLTNCWSCSSSVYYPEHARCSLYQDASYNIYNVGWTGCRYGYVDSTTGKCTSNCGVGKYGLATFNSKAMMETSYCYTCSSGCYECIDQYKCISCKKGYYLYTGSQYVSYGTCYAKSGTLSSAIIYVNTYAGWNSASSNGIDGSYSNAYNSLQDAITRAYEIGAPYTSATVYIYFKGTSVNAMYKFNPADFYMPMYRDDWSQTTKIVIDSYTGSQVTVNYKLKGGYVFKVGGGLTLKNVKFNAIDSLINIWVDFSWYNSGCTSTAIKYCCALDTNTQTITGDPSCIFLKTPTEECPTPTGAAFIEFDMSPQTMLTSPPQLTLYNVEFTNYFYEFDSFIKLNDYGGKISISSSKFTYFSTCGALIRNKVAPFKRYDIGTSSFQDLYSNRANNYQYDLYYDKKNRLSNPYSCSSSSLCFDLQIDSTTFSGFGILKTNLTEANWVDPTYKMQHQGSIIDLDGFSGNIAVRGSTFTSNTVHYSNCDISQNMDSNTKAFTDNYSNLGTKSVIQIKSLISVINHYYQFDLLGNVFTGNTGTKGIIFLDMKDRASSNRVLIAHNKFTQNGGYLDNNVIYLRARGPSASSIYTTTPSNGNLFCTGYHFQANTFTNNYGCTNYGGGVIKIECVENSDTYSEANDRYTHSTLSSTMQTNYANIDFTAFTTNTQSYTWNGVTYSIDFNQNTFSYNVYNENYATFDSGLVDLKGIPRVQFIHETYTGNGDMNKEALNKYATPNQYMNAGTNEMSISDALYNYPSTYTNSFKARSLISVTRVAQISMYNMTFSSNWLLESDYDTNRAQLASFSEFYGQLDIDQLYVSSQKGMNNAYFTTTLGGSISGLSTLQQQASMFPLIRWQSTDNVKISKLLSTGSTFSDVQFYQDSANTDSNMFFTVTASGGTYIMSSLTIDSANFNNVNCYQCTRSPLVLQANTILVQSSTFTNINNAAYSSGQYCYKPVFDIKLYKPYTLSTTTVTDTITFDYVTASYVYGHTDGRFIDITWATITGEQTPTTSQIFVKNSAFSNLYNDQNGGFAQIDVDTIQMTMSSVTFSNIYSGYSGSSASYGGVLYVKSLAQLTMASITASNFYAQQTTTANGGGRFIYLSQNAAFTMSISSSILSCYSTTFTSSTIQTQLTSSAYTQGSCFHLDTQTYGLTVTIDQTTVQNCYTSYRGAVVYLVTSSTTKLLTLTSNTMSGNAALNGGSVYCSGCTMTLQKNILSGNRAYNGGDFYIGTPLSSVTFDSHSHSSSLAYNNGGSIYYLDQSATSTTFTMNLASGTTSSYSSIQSTLAGGLVYFSVLNSLSIIASTTSFAQITATTSGGLFYVESSLTSLIAFSMTSCTSSTIAANGGSGSILYAPSTSTSSAVTITSSTLTSCTSTGNGGLFYLDGTTTKSISIISSSIQTISTSTGSGGMAYMSGTTNSLTIDLSSSISTSTAASNGGVVYMSGTGSHTLSLAGTISSTSTTSGNGGFAYVTGTSLTATISATIVSTTSTNGGLIYSVVSGDNSITLSSANIQSSSATGGSGGVFYLDGTTKTITITFSTITTSSSTSKGGIFYAGSSTTTIDITISSSTFNTFSANTDGSFISLQGGASPVLTLDISNSVFNCQSLSMWSSWPTIYNTIVSTLQSLSSNIGGAFYFGTGATGSITTDSNTFKQCYTTSAGAIFYLQSGMVLSDTSSIFKQNSGLYGQIYCDTCTATFTGTTFQDSVAYSGSVLYMNNGALVTFDSVIMSQGKAIMYGGAIYAGGTGSASIVFTSCASIIQYYESYQDGGFMYINNPDLTITSTSCSWQHLYALDSGGFVYGPSMQDLSISSCSMTNITSGSSGSFIASSTSGMTFSVSNCVFECLSTYSSSTVSSNINSGITTIGSLFDISNAASVTSTSNTFKYCYTASAGSVFKLTSTTFTDDGSTFSYNSALNGGAMRLSSVTATFTSTVFSNHNAQYGGVLYVDGTSTIDFVDVTVSSSTSSSDGGFLYAYDSSTSNTIDISFTGTTSLSTIQSTSGDGGTFYLDGDIDLSLAGTSTITSSYAYKKGGFAYIKNANSVTIDSSTQTSTYSVGSGSFIYSTSSNVVFSLSSSVFKCKSSTFSSNEPSLTNQVSGIGGAFYITDASSITSSSNSIENCYIGDVGGAYYLENTQMTDTSSTYKYTAALKGGAFYCKTCTLSITSSTFYYHQAYQGGVFYFEEEVTITLDNIDISNCYTAKNGGIVYATESTSPSSSSLTFQNTASIDTITSEYSGGSFYIDHSTLDIYMNTVVALTSSYVTNGTGGVFYFKRGKILEISGSTFTGYSSSSSGSFLYSVATDIDMTISSNTFDCMGSAWSSLSSTLSTPTYTYGGSFYISGATNTVSSTSNTFQNCYTGDYGGGISLISSSLSDSSSTFKYNGAQYGGAIYCDSCTLTLTSSIFQYNQAYNGGTFYIQSHSGTMTASSLSVSNTYAYNQGGMLYITGTSTNTLSLDSFTVTSTSSLKEGGMVYCSNSQQSLTVSSMTMTSSSAGTYGGVFYLDSVASVTISDGAFSTFSAASKGSFMYASSSTMVLSLSNNDIQCLTSAYVYSTNLQSKMTATTPTFDIGGAFYIISAISVTSSTNTIHYCWLCDQGSAYSLYSTTFTDTSSTYTSNAAIAGGLFFIDTSSVTITGATVSNTYANQGGVFHVIDQSPLSISSSTFTSSTATKLGGIAYHIDSIAGTGTYSVTITDCTFTTTTSGQMGGAFYFESSFLTSVAIDSCTFTSTTTGTYGGVFYVSRIGGGLTITGSSSSTYFSVFSASVQGSMLYSDDSNFFMDISDAYVQCKTSYSSSSATTALSDSTYSQAGAIYISSSTQGVTSQSNIYRYCYATNIGGIYTLISTSLSDQSSEFYSNQALNGGAIKCDTCSLTFSSSSFYSNKAQDGGAILMDNQVSMTATSTTFKSNTAEDSGGAVSIIQSSLSTLSSTIVKFISCNTITNNVADYGGFINIDNQYVSLYIKSSTVYSVSADVQGGVFEVLNVATITLTNSQFLNFYAPDSAFLYASSSSMYLYMDTSTFDCNTTMELKDVKRLLNKITPEYVVTTTFSITDAKNITSKQNTYTHCGVSQYGGVFDIANCPFYETSSSYTLNSASQGGVISCQTCTMNLKSCSFYQNYANKGGVILLGQEGYMKGSVVSFTENKAYAQAGVIYVSTQSYFDLISSQFIQNSANITSTIDILGSSDINNNTIKGCTFESNIAIKNTLSFMYAQVLVTTSEFKFNFATQRTKNIFIGFSTMIMSDCLFKSNVYKDAISRVLNEETYGTYIFIIFDVNLYVTNSKFYDGLASLGGAVYISGDCNVNFYSCQFKNNQAKTNGGAIYAAGFNNLYVGGAGTQLTNNFAHESGDDFYVLNSEKNFTIQNAIISNPNAKQSIRAETVSLIINNVAFSEFSGSGSETGAAIYCSNCRGIKIKSSSFRNMKSILGGAIYITETSINKKSTDKSGKYLIQDSEFSNIKAVTGGAIYADNPQYLTIKNSVFREITVSYNESVSNTEIAGSGGSLYYTCDSTTQNCVVYIQDCQFVNNNAEIQGGAIYWDTLEPKILNITYRNNSAGQYGDNIASFAQKIGIITQEQYVNNLKKLGKYTEEDRRRLLNESDSVSYLSNGIVTQQQSGGNIPDTYLALIDQYDQIVGSDFSSKVRVAVDSQYNSDPNANVYPPIIEGNSQFTAIGGVVKVSGISFAATPGYNYSISFSTDGIDSSKKANKDYMSTQNTLDVQFKLKVDLRECNVGEQFTSSGKCIECPEGTSYSLVKMTQPGSCEKCQSTKATCYGGSKIGPQPGYWRKTNTSSNFIKCLYTSACLGMIAPDYNPIGSCYTGYQGILCTDCAIGYSRKGDYECSKCPDNLMNGLRICAIFLGVGGALIFMIRSTLQGAKSKNNLTSIFFKIMMNHLQLVLLTASFDFKWPDQVEQFFNTAKPVAEVSQQMISFDCFLDSRKNYTDGDSDGSIRVFFQKLVMMALLPFICGLAIIGFWQTYKFIKKLKIDQRSKIMSTLVIVLFLAHPNIVQYMFYNFKCMTIDTEQRAIEDLEVVCWDSQHKFFSYFVAIPSIIVWGLGIPFFALILLTRIRKNLESIDSREKLGFLYRGYRKEFYYWEPIIMYRKILLIFISVFIGAYGVMAQALIVFMVLIFFLQINQKKKPFSTIALNDLETLSLLTSMLSIYCALYFITDDSTEGSSDSSLATSLNLSESTKLFFFSVIVISNLLFFIYWSYKMYLEIKSKIRQKLPRLYTCLCLCLNVQKYNREVAEDMVKEENEYLREELFKSLNNVKKLYRTGKLVLTRNTLERLQLHFDENKVLRQAGQEERQIQIEKSKKRFERNKISQDILNQTRADYNTKTGELEIDDLSMEHKSIDQLNQNYYDYEDIDYFTGKINVPRKIKGLIKIDDEVLHSQRYNNKKSMHQRDFEKFHTMDEKMERIIDNALDQHDQKQITDSNGSVMKLILGINEHENFNQTLKSRFETNQSSSTMSASLIKTQKRKRMIGESINEFNNEDSFDDSNEEEKIDSSTIDHYVTTAIDPSKKRKRNLQEEMVNKFYLNDLLKRQQEKSSISIMPKVKRERRNNPFRPLQQTQAKNQSTVKIGNFVSKGLKKKESIKKQISIELDKEELDGHQKEFEFSQQHYPQEKQEERLEIESIGDFNDSSVSVSKLSQEFFNTDLTHREMKKSNDK